MRIAGLVCGTIWGLVWFWLLVSLPEHFVVVETFGLLGAVYLATILTIADYAIAKGRQNVNRDGIGVERMR